MKELIINISYNKNDKELTDYNQQVGVEALGIT